MALFHSRLTYLVLLTLLTVVNQPGDSRAASQPRTGPACAAGWSLPNIKLKDHTLFAYQGFYYIAAIRIVLPNPDGRGEYTFAYVRTQDFCTWENLGTILGRGAVGAPDESYIWAPHVVQEGDTFFMFYTGVNRHLAQSIMLATSTNPADPQSWTRQGVVFRPNHAGMVYPGPASPSDARDPMLYRYGERYFLYYTGRDVSGGIVGVAMADQLTGPWQDLGAVLRLSSDTMPESPFVVAYADGYYLYYNAAGDAGSSPQWQWAPSPFGPWQAAIYEPVGWAHDFYHTGTAWLVSYVVGNGQAIQVATVRWDATTTPPRPRIGHQIYLPVVRQGELRTEN